MPPNEDDAAKADGPSEALIDISFYPSVESIAAVRNLVIEVANDEFGKEELTSRLAIAVHELLENCLKYSADGKSHLSLELTSASGRPRVVVTARNRASAERIRQLRALLDDLANAPDAMRHYQHLMRRSAEHSNGSGLGLARIRAECQMWVRGDLREDTVCLVVETLAE